MRSATTGPDEPGRRSRVHELGRMSRTQLIVIYQGLCDSTEGKAPRAVAGWSRDQLITAIRNREDGPWPEPVEDAEGAYSADGQCADAIRSLAFRKSGLSGGLPVYGASRSRVRPKFLQTGELQTVLLRVEKHGR